MLAMRFLPSERQTKFNEIYSDFLIYKNNFFSHCKVCIRLHYKLKNYFWTQKILIFFVCIFRNKWIHTLTIQYGCTLAMESYLKFIIIFFLCVKKRQRNNSKKKCLSKLPKPASSPPTIRLWATCFAKDIPQPESKS